MITDEQIVKEWDIFKRCDNCEHRGPSRCSNSGDGPIHECWCKLDGIPGPVHPMFGAGCSRWKLSTWIRENYEKEHAEAV